MRRVNLGPYLDGSYVPPVPAVGGVRNDRVRLLYPKRWHTCIGLTTAGKSWLALWHAIEELRQGHRVVYAHFEEHSPSGTLDRLKRMAPDLDNKLIKTKFIWLDCSTRWEGDEFAGNLPTSPTLVILDGINAACAQHGWSVDKPDAIGEYRKMFVTPSIGKGAVVLSLGHPVKSRERQNERHGYGSTAWLDEVDGAGFRLESSKAPIRKYAKGHSSLFAVKDRYGEVEQHGRLADNREVGWYYLGAFTVDSTHGDYSNVFLVEPSDEDNGPKDGLHDLGQAVVQLLLNTEGGGFASIRSLINSLRANGVNFNDKDLPPALERLKNKGEIEWPEVSDRKPRPGRLDRTALEDL